MQLHASVLVRYYDRPAGNRDAPVEVTTKESVFLVCDIPTSAICDEEIYYHMLKRVMPNLSCDVANIWTIDIKSNVPEACFELGLRINREEPEFDFELPHDDVFIRYLGYQFGIYDETTPMSDFRPVSEDDYQRDEEGSYLIIGGNLVKAIPKLKGNNEQEATNE